MFWSRIRIPDHFPFSLPLRNSEFWDIYYNFLYSYRPTFFTELCKMTNDPADIQTPINPEIRIRIPDHFRSRFWRWRRFALSEYSPVLGVSCRTQLNANKTEAIRVKSRSNVAKLINLDTRSKSARRWFYRPLSFITSDSIQTANCPWSSMYSQSDRDLLLPWHVVFARSVVALRCQSTGWAKLNEANAVCFVVVKHFLENVDNF